MVLGAIVATTVVLDVLSTGIVMTVVEILEEELVTTEVDADVC